LFGFIQTTLQDWEVPRGWYVPEDLEAGLLIGLGLISSWWLLRLILDYLNRRKIPKNCTLSLIPISRLSTIDRRLYRAVIDYNDTEGVLLQLLYLGKTNVSSRKIKYDGVMYTAIFWNVPLDLDNTSFYSILENPIVETSLYRVISRTGISMRFCAPSDIQWRYLISTYNIKINSRCRPDVYITPTPLGITTVNISVIGLHRDVS
jgi:hypothetical protein